MLRRVYRWTAAVGCVFLASCAGLPPRDTPLDQELARIVGLLPGEYVGEASDPANPGASMVIVHRIAPIDAPQLAEHVFYYQLSRDWAGGPVLQQKLFVFKRDADRAANLMSPYLFDAGQPFQDLDRKPALWAGLVPGQLTAFPAGCEFVWRASEAGMIGEVRRDDCAFRSERFDQLIRPDMSYELTAGRLIWTEALYDADGRPVVSTGGPLAARRQTPAP